MIVEPQLPGGFTVFCDDVRQEATGKLIYIGVYAGFMLVQQFPATTPIMTAVVTFQTPVESEDEGFLRLWHEVDGEDHLLAEVHFVTPAIEPTGAAQSGDRKEARMLLQVSPFYMAGPGRLKVRAYIADIEYRLGALSIALMPEPTQ